MLDYQLTSYGTLNLYWDNDVVVIDEDNADELLSVLTKYIEDNKKPRP